MRGRTGLRRALVAPLLAGLGCTALSACDFDGVYDLPLPGSPVDADEAYTVTAAFEDVLGVVPRSPVMVDDVVVGEVTEVERSGWHAELELRVRDDVALPDNTIAEIRQTSLLGEKYVDLAPPADAAPVGDLGEGDRLGLSATGRNPEVEEVLGALSFLLSGGGVGQIKQISAELNAMLDGRTADARHLLGQLEQLVGGLDEQKDDIIAAMEAVNRLAETLDAEKRTIRRAIDAVGPALAVLREQHGALVRMLGEMDRLGRVGTRVVNATKEDIVADLAHLQPILSRLVETGDALPRGLSLLISFPFPEEAAEIVKGDYANALFSLEISLESLVPSGGGGTPPPQIPGLPELPTIPGLPGLPDLLGGLSGLGGLGGVGTEGGLLGRGLGGEPR